MYCVLSITHSLQFSFEEIYTGPTSGPGDSPQSLSPLPEATLDGPSSGASGSASGSSLPLSRASGSMSQPGTPLPDLYNPGSLQDQENQADHYQASENQNPLDDHGDSIIDHKDSIVEGQNYFRTKEVQDMEKLISILRNAHLGDAYDGLDKESIYCLCNPPEEHLLLDD